MRSKFAKLRAFDRVQIYHLTWEQRHGDKDMGTKTREQRHGDKDTGTTTCEPRHGNEDMGTKTWEQRGVLPCF